MPFIEVHPASGAETVLLNVSEIEWVYEFAEKGGDAHAVLRLHGDRDSLEVKETYDQIKLMIAQANGQA